MSTPPVVPASTDGVVLRAIEPADLKPASEIVFRAFKGIHEMHRFGGAYPSLEIAERALTETASQPSMWGLAALVHGRLAGTTFVDERGPFSAWGPMTVDPDSQGHGVGRRLMQAMLERSAEARGSRMLQDAFNRGSLGLYATLGCVVREPIVLMAGQPRGAPIAGWQVRELTEGDVEACELLCEQVLGFGRTPEVSEALASERTPFVAVQDGEIKAYVTSLMYYPAGHAVAVDAFAMQALIDAAGRRIPSPSFLVPTRDHALFRWCVTQGFKVVKPMNYMTVGEYPEPQGSWLPSAVY